MLKATEKNLSRYQFTFLDLDRDPDLEKMANLKLAQILALAPYDATATGVVESSGHYYVTVLEIKSRFRTFQEKAAGTTPHAAVRRALERLEDQLHRWRFGGGTNSPAQPLDHSKFAESFV